MKTAEDLILRNNHLPEIRGRFNPVICAFEFAKIYIGFNLIAQEMMTPKGFILKIPIPFLTKNIYFLRFKKFIPRESFDGFKIRTDLEIKRLEELRDKEDRYGFTQLILEILYYIRDGPTR